MGAPQGLFTCLMVMGQVFAGLWFISYIFGGASSSPSSFPASHSNSSAQVAQAQIQASLGVNATQYQQMLQKSNTEEEPVFPFLLVAGCFICAACCVKTLGNLGQPKAKAFHILFDSEPRCLRVKEELCTCDEDEVLEKFQEKAKRYSKCPSGKEGGSLGTFRRGGMVKEFDEAVFWSAEIGKVYGPVWTDFGMHLIYVESRDEPPPMSKGHAG